MLKDSSTFVNGHSQIKHASEQREQRKNSNQEKNREDDQPEKLLRNSTLALEAVSFDNDDRQP